MRFYKKKINKLQEIMNTHILFQIDKTHFIINNTVFTLQEFKEYFPLGNWKQSARNITFLEENKLQCELRTIHNTWVFNELTFDYNSQYSNVDGKFVKSELSDQSKLPNGNWIESMIHFIMVEPTNEQGIGKLRCDLRNKYSSYTFNELEYNIQYTYNNINGEFFRMDEKITKLLKDFELIPKKIFQTHKNLSHVLQKYKLRTGYNSWNKYNNDYQYHFYSDEDCESFISNFFDERVYQAYQKCPLKVMKADLWRYCVIYEYGGIYADMDAVLMMDPGIFLQANTLLVFSPETDNRHLCQWTFAAPTRSPILKSIIDLCVDRILTCQEIKGESIIHELTGPKAFTDGIELFLKKMDCKTYPGKFKYENYQNYLLHCFNPHYFHNKVIRHLFAGSDEDGWKPERDRVLV
jgi:hypothetical protein